MVSPTNLTVIEEGENRFYVGDDGFRRPSATTILKTFCDTDWTEWAVKQGAIAVHSALKDDPPSVSQMAFTRMATVGYTAKRDYHAAVGSRVHELIDKGEEPDALDDRMVRQAYASWQLFLRDYDRYAETLYSELALIGETEDGFKYGGTIDRVMKVKGGEVLLELKTSRVLSSKAAIQTIAYRDLYAQRFGYIPSDWLTVRLNKYWLGYEVKRASENCTELFAAICALYDKRGEDSLWQL